MTDSHGGSGHPHRSLTYSPAIDGLRAVSVIGVMLYHGGVTALPGGFLGVDVFFVLSGFLITSLLLLEHERWGNIDLLTFWKRRARRLLPAMFLMTVVTCLVAWRLSDTDKLGGIRGDAIASIFYVANWQFILKDTSYFDQYGDPSPFRHMWSLAIEEQYYLVFPLLFGGLAVMLAHRLGRLAWVFLGTAVLSAVWMATLYDPLLDPSRVYYGTDTRAQELLIGAAAAVFAQHPPGFLRRQRWSPATWQVVGAVGLAGIVTFMFVAHDTDPWVYRGGFFALSVLAAMTMIAITQAPSSMASRLLSVKPVVAVGVISYGLYLWHWPVDVFVNPERTGLDGLALLTVRMVAALVPAVLSYHFLEKPIRHGALGQLRTVPRRLIILGSAPLATLAVVLATANATEPPKEVWSMPGSQQNSKPAGPEDGTVRTMLLGDSVAFGMIDHFPGGDLAQKVTVLSGVKLGCGLLPEPAMLDGRIISDTKLDCAGHAEMLPTMVDNQEPEVGIVFTGIGEQFDRQVDGEVLEFGSEEHRAFLRSAIQSRLDLFESKGIPTMLSNVPCHKVPDGGTGGTPPVINDDDRIAVVNEVVDEILADNPDTRLIDFSSWLCSNGYQDEMNGVRMRGDGLHFTEEGAAIAWNWLLPQVQEIAGPQRATSSEPGSDEKSNG